MTFVAHCPELKMYIDSKKIVTDFNLKLRLYRLWYLVILIIVLIAFAEITKIFNLFLYVFRM